jgi:hypothetical protein
MCSPFRGLSVAENPEYRFELLLIFLQYIYQSGAMDKPPVVNTYRASDREQFDFLSEVHSPDDSTRLIARWVWRYEQSPLFSPTIWM